MQHVKSEIHAPKLSHAEQELQRGIVEDIDRYRYPHHLLTQVKTVLEERKYPLFDRASDRVMRHLFTQHPELSYQGYIISPPDGLKCLVKTAARNVLTHHFYQRLEQLPEHAADQLAWKRNTDITWAKAKESLTEVQNEVERLIKHDRLIGARLSKDQREAAFMLHQEIAPLVKAIMPEPDEVQKHMYPRSIREV